MPTTRNESGSSLSDVVGPGQPMSLTELPTVRATLQHGIYLKERRLLEEGVNRRNYSTTEMVREIRKELVDCYHKANPQFIPPVMISDKSVERKIQVRNKFIVVDNMILSSRWSLAF